MYTNFNIRLSFNVTDRQQMKTYVRACREAIKLLSTQASLLNGTAPDINFTIENNEMGYKKIKVFEGEDK